MLREIKLRDDKTAQLSVTGGQVAGNDTVSISASRPSTLTHTHDLETCIVVRKNASPEGGVAVIDVPAVPCCRANLIERAETERPDVCFSELQYCDILTEGHSEPVTVLKDKGAEICLIREHFVRGWETTPTPIGRVKIRGVFEEPVEADLVFLRIKPHPSVGLENIAPPLNVIFAVCALTTDVEVILCGTAIEEIEALSTYSVPKPSETSVNTDETMIESDLYISDQVTKLWANLSSTSSDCGSSELQEQSKEIVAKVTAINVTTNSVDSELSPETINHGDETSQLLSLDPSQIANAEKFKAEQLADISLEREIGRKPKPTVSGPSCPIRGRLYVSGCSHWYRECRHCSVAWPIVGSHAWFF